MIAVDIILVKTYPGWRKLGIPLRVSALLGCARSPVNDYGINYPENPPPPAPPRDKKGEASDSQNDKHKKRDKKKQRVRFFATDTRRKHHKHARNDQQL